LRSFCLQKTQQNHRWGKNAIVADEQCTKGVNLGTKKMDWSWPSFSQKYIPKISKRAYSLHYKEAHLTAFFAQGGTKAEQ
jgi:hypothetical protein